MAVSSVYTVEQHLAAVTNELTVMDPSQIPLGWYTHINFAFSLLDPIFFAMDPMSSDVASLYKQVTHLKSRTIGLEVWISIGGWAFNDPGKTRTTFSDLAASPEIFQEEFFHSLITFMLNNNFDGVDIDWEYPVAKDRGGIDADFKNFVTLLARLRKRLNSSGRDFGLSITIVSLMRWIYCARVKLGKC